MTHPLQTVEYTAATRPTRHSYRSVVYQYIAMLSARLMMIAAVLAVCLLQYGSASSSPQSSFSLSTLEVYPTLVGETWINITLETFPTPVSASSSASASACAQTQTNMALHQNSAPVPLLSFLNLHENENTSVVAVRNFLYFNGGKLVRFNKGNSRLVNFVFQNASYTVDPNRIFTPKGIEDTLRTYSNIASNQVISQDLVQQVEGLATALLTVYDLDNVGVVLALHNNGGTYGANSYLPGGPYEHDAAKVYISTERNPSDFFYVIDPAYYEYLSSPGREYNVVLQDDTTVTDDGSLSYYCGQNEVNKQYINFEAVAETGEIGGQVVVQLDMIQQIKQMLMTVV